jgi:hypothetical protein
MSRRAIQVLLQAAELQLASCDPAHVASSVARLQADMHGRRIDEPATQSTTDVLFAVKMPMPTIRRQSTVT